METGVRSVREIYAHYKAHGIRTIVMGASLRSTDQVKALAGCDRLTIESKLFVELAQDTTPLQRRLTPSDPTGKTPLRLDEPAFRWALNENRMATEKPAEGIRNFNKDHKKLMDVIVDNTCGP